MRVALVAVLLFACAADETEDEESDCPVAIHLGPTDLPDARLGEHYQVHVPEHSHIGGIPQPLEGVLPEGIEFDAYNQLIGAPAEIGVFTLVYSTVDHGPLYGCPDPGPSTDEMVLRVLDR